MLENASMLQIDSTKYDAVLADQGQDVWRLIVRILGNDGHDAADCFQQAFVELVSRQKRSNDIRNVGALLRRIASVRAIDTVRRRIRDRKRTQDTDESLIVSSKENNPSIQAEASEFIEDLRIALTELPEQQASAFVLIEIENVSRNEAALAIGVSVNHLGVLLYRARAALRVHLVSHSPIREKRS